VLIINNAGHYVNFINSLLKGLKSTLQAEFIQLSAESITITTNNVPASNDLSTIKKYIKSIEGIGQNEVAALHCKKTKENC